LVGDADEKVKLFTRQIISSWLNRPRADQVTLLAGQLDVWPLLRMSALEYALTAAALWEKNRVRDTEGCLLRSSVIGYQLLPD